MELGAVSGLPLQEDTELKWANCQAPKSEDSYSYIFSLNYDHYFNHRDVDDDTASSGSSPGEIHLPAENVNLVDLGSDEIDTKMQMAPTTGLFQQSHNLE